MIFRRRFILLPLAALVLNIFGLLAQIYRDWRAGYST